MLPRTELSASRSRVGQTGGPVCGSRTRPSTHLYWTLGLHHTQATTLPTQPPSTPPEGVSYRSLRTHTWSGEHGHRLCPYAGAAGLAKSSRADSIFRPPPPLSSTSGHAKRAARRPPHLLAFPSLEVPHIFRAPPHPTALATPLNRAVSLFHQQGRNRRYPGHEKLLSPCPAPPTALATHSHP